MPVLFGAGLLLCGIFTLLAYNTYFVDGRRPADTIQVTTDQETEELSFFEEHYVGAGHKIVRIPHVFCPSTFSELDLRERYTSEVGERLPVHCPNQTFIELDLEKHPLPVTAIQSAVTYGNGEGKIFYTTPSDAPRIEGTCPKSDLFSYDPSTKVTKKLADTENLWHCGAIISELLSVSEGGRYLKVRVEGYAPTRVPLIYDTALETVDIQLDSRLSNYGFDPITFSLKRDKANTDDYTLYTGYCTEDEIEPHGMGRFCRTIPAIMLRDNTSEEATVRLVAIQERLTRALDGINDYDLEPEYNQKTGTLRFRITRYINSVEAEKDTIEITIPNFDQEVRRLLP